VIEAGLLAAFAVQAHRQAGLAGIAAEQAVRADERRRAHRLAVARSRWMADHRAEGVFPCGVTRPVLPVSDDGHTVRDHRTEVQVFAAALADSLVFLVEPPEGWPRHDPIEVGTIRRDAIAEVDVVDERGTHVPEPVRESLEPEPEVELVLRWSGDPGEQRLTFRSPWLTGSAPSQRSRAECEPRARQGSNR
jgi:hypothetical protein